MGDDFTAGARDRRGSVSVAGMGDGTGRLSRRALLQIAGLIGGGAAVSLAGLPHRAAPVETAAGDSARSVPLNTGWLFGGEYTAGADRVAHDDRTFAPVTLPHTVAPLSWGGWNPATWQKVWIYRRHLDGSALRGGRVFVDFDGVMLNAEAVLNDTVVGSHRGGYLPWSVELTDHLVAGDNVLAVVVDARCLPVPPVGPGCGPAAVDYLQPGGIYRDASLRVVPRIHVADLFARPMNVLSSSRSVDVECTIDAAEPASGAQLTVELLDGGSRRVATESQDVDISDGTTIAWLRLTELGEVSLWSPDEPTLYTVRVTLSVPGVGSDTVERRIGFREPSFRPDGFFLNGERLKLFGLNRHQLFPYTGMAAPARLQRRDAEILRYELNCNMVRCSHYPQSPHFLDACDEIGLMVWEETPGWQHLGGRAWQDLVVQNVHDMVTRDRSRPSVILWGTRLDETPNNSALYSRTHQLAHDLDGSRPTTGATLRHSTARWTEDVFGFDDYHAAHGNARLLPPLPGVPYLISEAVGALDGSHTYRWIDSGTTLASQARLHAQVHHLAAADPRYAGVLGWAGFDYASLNGGHRVWHGLKTPGVLDGFRVPKLGAALYRSQVDPAVNPVVLPVFFWDFGPGDPPGGPGPDAMIATNCDRLELFVADRHVATAVPDTARFGGLKYPPVFADLSIDGGGLPDLRIDGYVANRLVTTTLMSADTTRDSLRLTADDTAIKADGSDATRITFHAADAYGNLRPTATGDVSLALTGPAVLVGDNPFPFSQYGGVGGAFIRSKPGRAGPIRVTAGHPRLGTAHVQITSTAAS